MLVHGEGVWCSRESERQGEEGMPLFRMHTILKYGGPIKSDHDLIRIFIFLHIAHFAQVLGLHQRIVFAISLGSGGFNWSVE